MFEGPRNPMLSWVRSTEIKHVARSHSCHPSHHLFVRRLQWPFWRLRLRLRSRRRRSHRHHFDHYRRSDAARTDLTDLTRQAPGACRAVGSINDIKHNNMSVAFTTPRSWSGGRFHMGEYYFVHISSSSSAFIVPAPLCASLGGQPAVGRRLCCCHAGSLDRRFFGPR